MTVKNTKTSAIGAVYDSPRVRVVLVKTRNILCMSGEGTEGYGEGRTYEESAIIWG